MTLEFQPFDLPFRIRQSSLEDAKCLFRFHKIHVLKQRDPESEFALRGTHFHDLAKRYVDFLRNSHQESDWEYGDELVESKDWNLEAIGIFKNWIRSRSFSVDQIFATEYKVRLGWDLKSRDEDDPKQAKQIVFSADMDILEIRRATATTVDYKTHFMSFKPTTIQSIVYPWMILHLMPNIDTVQFQLEFVRWGISPEPREFTRDDLPMMDRYVEQQVLRLVSALETNDWPATVNSKCAYCMLECPLVKDGLTQETIGQVQTQEHAAEMAQQLYALHLASKRLHANLKNWATRHGPIDAGNDIRIGFKKSNKVKHSAPKLMQLNEQHGFAPTRALRHDSVELKKIGASYPEYLLEAMKVAKDASTTSFKFWNEVGDPLDKDTGDDE